MPEQADPKPFVAISRDMTQASDDVAAEALLRDALRNSDMPWTSSESKVMETAKLAVATLREAGLLRLTVREHQPDNPQGVWCCDTHRDEFNTRQAGSKHQPGCRAEAGFPCFCLK